MKYIKLKQKRRNQEKLLISDSGQATVVMISFYRSQPYIYPCGYNTSGNGIYQGPWTTEALHRCI